MSSFAEVRQHTGARLHEYDSPRGPGSNVRTLLVHAVSREFGESRRPVSTPVGRPTDEECRSVIRSDVVCSLSRSKAASIRPPDAWSRPSYRLTGRVCGPLLVAE